MDEALGPDNQLDAERPSPEVIHAQYALARSRLPLNPKSKQYRPEEWKLVTALRELRQYRKHHRPTARKRARRAQVAEIDSEDNVAEPARKRARSQSNG